MNIQNIKIRKSENVKIYMVVLEVACNMEDYYNDEGKTIKYEVEAETPTEAIHKAMTHFHIESGYYEEWHEADIIDIHVYRSIKSK